MMARPHNLTRRNFLALATSTAIAPSVRPADTATPAGVAARIHGLMIGSAVGDALGGPIEFQEAAKVKLLPTPPKQWQESEIFDAPARQAAAARLTLRSYRELRPAPESYGQWPQNAEPGTVTDDTRHKLVLLLALHTAADRNRPLDARGLAQAYLDWPATPAVTAHPGFAPLAADALEEYSFSARWVVGERNPAVARPPERLWNGIPTCCGQMGLLPLAALFPGQPEEAYRAAYHLAFFDNGYAKDMNAALVAALSVALVTPVDPASPRPAWQTVLAALRSADPYGHAKIRWSIRQVDRWLDLAHQWSQEAQGRPARFFATLEKEFAYNSKWEAQVPFVVVFGCLALAEYEPLPALQLCLEWGWDTDSYAQLLGAFIGALYGPEIFAAAWREAVENRLRLDHAVDLAQESAFLDRLRTGASRRPLVAQP
jgi:ADP-ribosylglycohydrolase